MHRYQKQASAAIALLASVLTATSVYAEETKTEYELDPVIVTAQKYATDDLSTPASVEVLTHDQLVATGGASLVEALKFSTGITYNSQGPRGTSQGTMTSKIMIRGVEKGTLVLVDGVPLNQNGRYHLDDIPVEIVEKVEIIRGGGAVLYGSEATGGVINIITKGKRENSVRTAFGNYGSQSHALNMQADKFGLSYSYDKTGAVDNISNPASGRPTGMYYNTIRGEHNTLNMRYDFNDTMYLTHTYGENNSHYVYRYSKQQDASGKDIDYKNAIHTTVENNTQLHYEKDDWKAILSYVSRDQETNNRTAKKVSGKYVPGNVTASRASTDDASLGLDVQKKWLLGHDISLVGFNYQQDTCANENVTEPSTAVGRHDFERDMYAFYGQYNRALNSRENLIFSARETWATNSSVSSTDKNFSKFTPELEYIRRLDKTTSFYSKAAQSFMMPTFTQLYGSGDNVVGNANLQPQHGTHYEVGWKRNVDAHAWRLAVFNYTIKDSIEVNVASSGEFTYSNEDVKNTGVELTCNVNMNDHWQGNWGVSYGNPKRLAVDNGVSNGWRDYSSKLQLKSGLAYKKDKWSGAVNANYLGQRTRDASPYDGIRPQLFADLNIAYRPTKEEKIYLNVENLFDRDDITTSSTSTYYALGINFMLGYERKF